MSSIAPLHRTLEHELNALLRGASLECLVCGEFVMHHGPVVRCPECGTSVAAAGAGEDAALQFELQTG